LIASPKKSGASGKAVGRTIRLGWDITPNDQLRELTATGFYLPDLRLAIERVDRSFSDTADLRKAILLAGAVQILNLLIE
jgi:hypothetical protein